jgi:hypothetical protein
MADIDWNRMLEDLWSDHGPKPVQLQPISHRNQLT